MDKNALKFTALFLVLILSVACQNKRKQERAIEPQNSEEAQSSEASWPKPNRFLGDIPVYETFDEIEPLFRQQNDTTYIVNFWATWCKPCIEELPYFESFTSKKQDQPTKVVLVSLDFPQHLENKLLPFVEKHKLQSDVEVLLDGSYNDWIDKVSPEWSGAIPATYIYRDENYLFVGEPFESYDDLLNSVKTIL